MTRMKRVKTEIKKNGRKLLMAGLGAAVITGESCRDSFRTLVAKGRQTKDQGKGEGRAARLRKRFEDLSGKWQTGWNRGLESTLNRVGLPSRQEILRLTQSVEQLTDRIENLAVDRA